MSESNYLNGTWLIRCELCNLVMGYSAFVPTRYVCVNCYDQANDSEDEEEGEEE